MSKSSTEIRRIDFPPVKSRMRKTYAGTPSSYTAADFRYNYSPCLNDRIIR
ncbi:MAG: hypothetical protein LBH00_06845 [Planctomycetaceae bacterium]|nr:hypothetical protein [Planctomycetaceae bacterium]